MADCHENTIGLDVRFLAGVDVAYAQSPHAFVAEHVYDDRVPAEGDLLVQEGPILHDLGCSQFLRRWTIITESPNFVRNSASSSAESPPPTTTIRLSGRRSRRKWRRSRLHNEQASFVVETEHERSGSCSDNERARPQRWFRRARVSDPHAHRVSGKVNLEALSVMISAPKRSA